MDLHCKYIQFLIVSTFHWILAVRFTFLPYTVQCRSYSKKNCNQLYNYSTVLGAATKCKPYSEITVEIGTQLKTVKITSNIFGLQI